VKEPRSGARTASPCPAPDCVITFHLTDWHYAQQGGFYCLLSGGEYDFFQAVQDDMPTRIITLCNPEPKLLTPFPCL
jgi:hypothetical protein